MFSTIENGPMKRPSIFHLRLSDGWSIVVMRLTGMCCYISLYITNPTNPYLRRRSLAGFGALTRIFQSKQSYAVHPTGMVDGTSALLSVKSGGLIRWNAKADTRPEVDTLTPFLGYQYLSKEGIGMGNRIELGKARSSTLGEDMSGTL